MIMIETWHTHLVIWGRCVRHIFWSESVLCNRLLKAKMLGMTKNYQQIVKGNEYCQWL